MSKACFFGFGGIEDDVGQGLGIVHGEDWRWGVLLLRDPALDGSVDDGS